MSVHYKLTSMQNQEESSDCPQLIEIDALEVEGCKDILIESISPVEFKQLNIYQGNEHYSPVTIIQSESNFIDDYPNCTVGSFSIPSKELGNLEPYNLAFYMDKQHLIFVDETDFSEKLIKDIANSGMLTDPSTAHCLFLAFKMMLNDDLEYLADVEDKMEEIEEKLVVQHMDIDNQAVMEYRRLSMRLASFYQQLTTMSTMLSDNDNKLMTHSEARAFSHITNLSDRLASKAETLKEYGLQLHEMHQTRIDLTQNATMQVLTIVTVLIAPMTLITGWFGMNLTNIPGLDWPLMWIALIVLFIACTVLLLVLFKKKKWL